MNKKAKKKRAVTNSHVQQIRKLKDRLSGKEDDRAQLQAAAKAAYTYAAERALKLEKLRAQAAETAEAWQEVAGQLKAFTKRAEAATELFKGEPPGDDSVQIVIEERDAAVAEAQRLREQLAEQSAELSELRLYKLDQQEPRPPKWLQRAEVEFEKAARILTNDVKTVVAQKALDWAGDYRRLQALARKPEANEAENEKG